MFNKSVCAYLRREMLRKEKRQNAAKKKRVENGERIHHICEMYEQAYYMWASRHIHVRYLRGWYYVRGVAMHEREIIAETNKILAALHQEELCNGISEE